MGRKKQQIDDTESADTPVAEAEVNSRGFVEHARRGGPKYSSFDDFWFKLVRDRKVDKDMKPHLLVYFRSLGILADPSQYDDGLQKFGL